MLTINDMREGNKYLIGDSLGYDLVICTQVPHLTTYQGSTGIMVKYISLDKNGNPYGDEDFLFETPNCGFSTYIEPR